MRQGATQRLRRRVSYGLAFGLAFAALVAMDLSREQLPGGGGFLLLLIAVTVGAVMLGVGQASASLLLSATGALLLVPLRGHPWLQEPSDAARLALFLLEGGLVILVVAQLRRTRRMPGSRLPSRVDGAARRLVEPLTVREQQVLRLAAAGMTIEAIGRELYLSRNTVKSHLSHAYGKLGAHNRAEAIAAGLHWGCLTRSDLTPAATWVGLSNDSP